MSQSSTTDMVQAPLAWTDPSNYAELILARSNERRWGFGAHQLAGFRTDEVGPESMLRSSVELWLGRTFEYNWDEMLCWLEDAIKPFGFELQTHVEPDDLVIVGVYNPQRFMNARCTLIDLSWVATPDGGYFSSDRSQWPTLSELTFLALNPQMVQEMGVRLPMGFVIPGIGFIDRPYKALMIRRTDNVLKLGWINVTE